MTASRLTLHEELMLLALRDREGTVFGGTMYPYGIAGAVIAELALEERIDVAADRRNRVSLRDPTPLGNPLLDEWLSNIQTSKKDRAAADWVSWIASKSDLKHRVAVGLVRRGILRADEESVLWIFSRKIYPEVDHRPEGELIQRVENALRSDEPVDARTAVLVTLADATNILSCVIDRKELKARRERLEALADGDAVVESTAAAIEAVQTAMMVTLMVPAIVTSTIIVN